MFQNALPAVLLLIVMVGVAWVLQRYRRHLPGVLRQSGPALKLLNALPLGPHQRVVTVQVGEGASRVCLVLGVAPGGVTALHSMPMPPEPEAPAVDAIPAVGFAARLAQFTKGPHAPR
jgi:flagellar protein FliO/FliZ